MQRALSTQALGPMEDHQEAMMTTNPPGDSNDRLPGDDDRLQGDDDRLPGDASLSRDLIAMIGGEVSLDPTASIAADTDLLLSGLVDSLGVVQIVGWLEDRFGVQIDPVDIVLENFESVDAIVAFAGDLTNPPA